MLMRVSIEVENYRLIIVATVGNLCPGRLAGPAVGSKRTSLLRFHPAFRSGSMCNRRTSTDMRKFERWQRLP